MNRTIQGIRGGGGPEVTVDGRPLPLRLDLCRHSPTGFEWGYGGSGPAQLALALVSLVTEDDDALEHYHGFKADVVATLPHRGWRFTTDAIAEWVERRRVAEPCEHIPIEILDPR